MHGIDTGRPVPGEYDPYYQSYIDRVPNQPIMEVLEEQRHEIMGFLGSLDKATAEYRYEPDKWTIKEVLGHLVDTERIFGARALCFARREPADPGVPKLDMYLYGDASGSVLLDRDISNDNYPVVSFCSAQDGTIVAETKVESGAGWFLIHVYSKVDDGTVKRTMDVVESAAP